MTLTGPARKQWSAVVDAASEPYRKADRFAWRFARGKLGFDPVFRHLMSQGLIAPNARVLDIGCGQGLLASLIHAGTQLSQQGRWPSGWAAPPAAAKFTGIELAAREVERARASLGGGGVEIVCGDMRHTPFPEVDTVVILDVLHYITVPEQNEVLARVRRALPPGGSLVLRIADVSTLRFVFSRWVDAMVTWLRGYASVPRYSRTIADWTAQLESLGFLVRSRQPMSRGTPFANVLLVATVPSSP